MMKFIRWFLGKILLSLDRAFSPTPLTRIPAEQDKLNAATANLSVYEFLACPFCIKVRRFLKANSLEIPTRDATKEPYRQELLVGGGKLQVPCLRISNADGSSEWMYESSDIIAYLKAKYSLV